MNMDRLLEAARQVPGLEDEVRGLLASGKGQDFVIDHVFRKIGAHHGIRPKSNFDSVTVDQFVKSLVDPVVFDYEN